MIFTYIPVIVVENCLLVFDRSSTTFPPAYFTENRLSSDFKGFIFNLKPNYENMKKGKYIIKRLDVDILGCVQLELRGNVIYCD